MYAVIVSPRIAVIASDAVRHDPLSLHEWKQKLCGKCAATQKAPCLPKGLNLVMHACQACHSLPTARLTSLCVYVVSGGAICQLWALIQEQ